MGARVVIEFIVMIKMPQRTSHALVNYHIVK